LDRRRVLLVEDKEDQMQAISTAIAGQGFEVLTAEDGETALEIFQRSTILVVVTDLKMPKKDGFEVLESIRRQQPATRVIIITGLQKDNAITALRLQAFDYIQKGNSQTIPGLLKAIERAYTQAETQIETEKQMLSFLTHTLRNTLSGGPETVKQVFRLVLSSLGDKYQETAIYKVINNLASLHSVFNSVSNMLDAYKIYANQAGEIDRKWREDTGGSVDLWHLVATVLKQTVARILFEEPYLGQFKTLLATAEGPPIKEVRESFLRDVLWSETTAQDRHPVLTWLSGVFPVVVVKIDGPSVSFNTDGVRFNLLFAAFSEIVFNALKYSDGREPIQVQWLQELDTFVFSCRNTFSEPSRHRSASQKGLAFIGGLTRMVQGIELSERPKEGVFDIALRIKSSLLS
jgi:CheY-like chemotaxis protein